MKVPKEVVKHVPKTVKKKICVSTKAHDHGYGNVHEVHVHDDHHGGYGHDDHHGGYGHDDHHGGGYGHDDHKHGGYRTKVYFPSDT